jgi:WD repeat-containing protein 92
MGITAKAKGIIQVFEMNRGELTMVSESIKPEGIKCGTFGASSIEERHLACGDYKGKVAIYDLGRQDVPIYNVQGHNGIINAIDGIGGQTIGYGAPEIVTGGRDGCVRVWDPRVPEPVVSLEPDEGQSIRDCWSVAFGNSYNDEERVVAAGYDNGDIKLFDLRTNTLRYETNVKNGVTGIDFDRKDIEMNKFTVTTLESKFRVYDARTQHPTEGFAHLSEKAHKSTVWLAKSLPQNRDIFMTGGGNGGFNLYKYHYPASRTKQAKDQKPMGVSCYLKL